MNLISVPNRLKLIGSRLNIKYEMEDALSDITTLDLEDSQVRYPNSNNITETYLFGGKNYDLYLINKDELRIGPFEIFIKDGDEEIIGFIRGTHFNSFDKKAEEAIAASINRRDLL